MRKRNLKLITLLLSLILLLPLSAKSKKDLFPDGTPVSEWFKEIIPTDINKLGKQYRITDYGVKTDSTILQTEQIQSVIDKAHNEGGGVIIVPKGTFLSGSLFFKPKTHLHLEEGAMIKGSDDISHFALVTTRMEGQTVKYFAALVNADGVDGFTLSGKGTLNGNGLRYWKSFWLRRQFNSKCTNMDEMRPRVLYISNSKDVQVSGVRLINSPFWTSHYYKCENVKILGLYIYAPSAPVKAPSSDAIDLDVCKNVLIKDCYMSVNDDAVVLKGGKGPYADKDDNNGGNYNIIIEDCTYGFCHSAFTCGSESIHNRNIIFRRCKLNQAKRVVQFKMRPDTPQNYEYILVEDLKGNAENFLSVAPWKQFFDLKGEKDIRPSFANHVTMRNINIDCYVLFDVAKSDQYTMTNFIFENFQFTASKRGEINTDLVENFQLRNITVNGQKLFK